MIHDFRVFILIFVGQVVQQQTEAIARLGNVLKRDIRDMEIIMAEDTELTDWANKLRQSGLLLLFLMIFLMC